MKPIMRILLICILLIPIPVGALSSGAVTNKHTLFMFWNVENFFDCFDDKNTADDEFTPGGERRWTWKKFIVKRNAIAKTIIAAGGEEMPVIIALAEVENRFVLEQLVRNTPLARSDYGIVHRDSPDARGIDVALLYRKNRFKIEKSDFFRVDFENRGETTRLILYVKGVIDILDTIHLFVNHWPSKLGGEIRSMPKRRAAADKLRMACDSVFNTNSRANIIITGDFNDTPDSKLFDIFKDFENLTMNIFKKGVGSIKYRGSWELIDQFFVSPNLTDTLEPVYFGKESASLFNPTFLLESDREFTGDKPKRIYRGPMYNGGISDHLPLLVKLNK